MVITHDTLGGTLYPLARLVVADVDLSIPVDIALLGEIRLTSEPVWMPPVVERARCIGSRRQGPSHPQAELHAIRVQIVGERFRAVRKPPWVPTPVPRVGKPHRIRQECLES